MLKTICILEFADDTTTDDINELGETLDKHKHIFSDIKLCRTNTQVLEDKECQNVQ